MTTEGTRTASDLETEADPLMGERGDQHPSLEEGARLGRYLVLNRVGAGGMGVVYAAYDPELDRRVAVKLLHYGKRGGESEGKVDRLVQEARSMARLSHPNVVSVFDVGKVDDRVFVAMEFIEGQTLRTWLESERTFDELVDAFTAAGEGLAAAHRADVVHRDFKPDNVMVADDGRVLVTDFGLARWSGAQASDDADEHESSGHEGEQIARGSAATAHQGTPAYMAPEQHLGRIADARTDQFAYCVAMWEALFGQRPFEGDTLAGLSLAVTEGRRRPPPQDPPVTGIPRALERTLDRGLQLAPEDRHADMPALLREIRAATKPPSTGRWLAVVGLVGLMAALGWVATSSGEDVCADIGSPIASVWSEKRVDSIRGRWEQVPGGYGEEAFPRARKAVDAFALRWSTMRVDACRAHTERAETSAVLYDRQLVCFDRRLQSLAATVDEMEAADSAQLPAAVSAALSLPSLESCTNREALLAAVEPPTDPEVERIVMELRGQIEQTRARRRIRGEYHDSKLELDEIVKRAEATDYAPIIAEALLDRAKANGSDGQMEDAAKDLRRALRIAEIAGDDQTAAEVGLEWAALDANDGLGRPAEGRVWAEYAEVKLDRVRAGPTARAALANLRGRLAKSLGEYDVASQEYRRGLQTLDENEISEPILRATLLNNLGNVESALGKRDEALELYDRALEIREAELGPNHPDLGQTWHNISLVHQRGHKLDEALAAAQRSGEIMRTSLGPDHPDLGGNASAIGIIYAMRGEFERAHGHFSESVRIAETAFGPDHPAVNPPLVNLGGVLAELGRMDEAIEVLRRAIAIGEQQNGPDDPRLSYDHNMLGNAYFEAERFPEALSAYERGLELSRAGKLDPQHLAACAFNVAKTLRALERDPERQLELAHETLAILEAGGEAFAKTAAEVRTFIERD